MRTVVACTRSSKSISPPTTRSTPTPSSRRTRADALVYDVNREFWGTDAIRAWVAKEIVGERVTIEVTEVREHHGTTIVRGRYDGTYDKSKLPPGDLILTNYIRV